MTERKRVEFEDFPDAWEGFLQARAKMIVWLRRWGNEGEPLSFPEVATILNLTPGQAAEIFDNAVSLGLSEAEGPPE